MTAPSKDDLLVLLGRLLMVVSLVFLASTLVANFDEMPRIQLNGASVFTLVLAVASSVVVNAIGALAWGRLLGASARNAAAYPLVFRIWAMSNVARYLPGNVFHYASRAALAQRAGFPIGAVVTSMTLEAFFVCLAPLVLVLLGVLTNSLRFASVGQVVGQVTLVHYVVAIGVLVCGGAAAAYFFPGVWNRISRNIAGVGIAALTAALVGYLITFLVMGTASMALLDAFWNVDQAIGWYELSCGYALAFLLGYIVPGAPGGIGIREGIMVALFSAAIGAGPVLGLAVLLRLASIVGDVISFAIGYLVREQAA